MEMKENQQEIDLVMDYWRKRGIWTTKRRLISWGGNADTVEMPSNLERCACGTAVGILAITWDGKATNCVMDVDAKYLCGDVTKESIKSIWQRRNKELVEKHKAHRWDELPKICKNCLDWQIVGEERFDEKGVAIEKNYAIKGKMIE